MYIEEAISFVEENKLKTNFGQGNCLVGILQDLKVPQVIKQKRHLLIEKYNLHNKFYSPFLPDCFFILEPNKHIPLHKDSEGDEKYFHHRVVWIVQEADFGAELFTNDNKILLKTNVDFLLDCSKEHEVSTNIGNTNLIGFTFGFIEKKIYV